ncbi:hypothetical protein EON65_13850 [archaeon]|nr:MAG: hypothetical protein EON65_13850 [archaeon]
MVRPSSHYFALVLSYAAALRGTSLIADVSLKLRPLEERKIAMVSIPVKRNVSDDFLVEQGIDAAVKKTHFPKEHFRAELSRTDSLVTIDVVPVWSDFSWCGSCGLITDRLTKVEDELRELKGERLSDKENALLRQIALDIERTIKIAIIDNIPELKQQCFNKRRGVWFDSEIGSRHLETLWREAEKTEGLCQQILAKFSLDDVGEFDGLLDELKGIKDLFNSTAHPVTQPNGQPVDKAYCAGLFAKHAARLSDCRIVQRLVQTIL